MGSIRLFVIAAACLVLVSRAPAAQHFSEWSEPVNLGPVVNSTFSNQAPAVSKDGLSLYFHSNRPGGFGLPGTVGTNDIWISQRNSVDEPWGPPANLGDAINSPMFESRPELSRDGHWLFFSSNRAGGFTPGLDIWASYRQHVHDDFAWEPPVHLGLGVNSPSDDFAAAYVENDDAGAPLLFFASNRPGGSGAFDIYVSERLPDGTWASAMWMPDLSSSLPDLKASVRFDGLEAFLVKGVPPAAFDLWVSTRETVFHPWSEPVNLGPRVNTPGDDSAPHIASDRRTLYFESSRGGGVGGRDLWVTTRARK